MKIIFDYKLLVLTIISLTLMMPIFSIVHEMGHGALCFADGRDFTWGLYPLGGAWLSCEGTFDDPIMFRLAGGLAAALAASTILILVLPHLGKNTACIAISIAAIAVTEYVIALLEGFANDFYMHSPFSSGVSAIIIVSIIFWLILRNSHKREVYEEN